MIALDFESLSSDIDVTIALQKLQGLWTASQWEHRIARHNRTR
jgi:hypothetical protein